MDVYDLRIRLLAIRTGPRRAKKHEEGLLNLAAECDASEPLLTFLADKECAKTQAVIDFIPETDWGYKQVIDLIVGLISEITRTDDDHLHHLPLARMVAWLAAAPTSTMGDLRDLTEAIQAWEGFDQGWVYHAAGLTPAEYATSPMCVGDAQVLAALRGYSFPPSPAKA